MDMHNKRAAGAPAARLTRLCLKICESDGPASVQPGRLGGQSHHVTLHRRIHPGEALCAALGDQLTEGGHEAEVTAAVAGARLTSGSTNCCTS